MIEKFQEQKIGRQFQERSDLPLELSTWSRTLWNNII